MDSLVFNVVLTLRRRFTGKRMSNERIVDLEKRHADLALKDLGASEISDRLSCISWLICGSEVIVALSLAAAAFGSPYQGRFQY